MMVAPAAITLQRHGIVLQRQVDEQEQRTQIMREAAEVQRRMLAETERSKAAERQAALAESQRAWRKRNSEWMADKAITAVCCPSSVEAVRCACVNMVLGLCVVSSFKACMMYLGLSSPLCMLSLL